MKYQFYVLNTVFKEKLWKWFAIFLIFLFVDFFLIYVSVNTDFFSSKNIINLLSLKKIFACDFISLLLM